MKSNPTLVLLAGACCCLTAASGAELKKASSEENHLAMKGAASPYFVYIGTYTGPKSKGIYACRMNPSDGGWSAPELAAEIPSPSFLAVHPNGQWLYAVSEVGDARNHQGGSVSAYRVEPGSGKLTLLNQQSSGGDSPCHLVVDKTGRCVIVANYGSGSVTVLPVAADGRLRAAASFVQHYGSSVNPQRQKEPHAHGITLDAANRVVLVTDLGMDKVLGYKLEASVAEIDLRPDVTAQLKPGAGPRHAVLHPNGRFLYVIDELDSTVTVFGSRPLRDALKPVESVSTVPADFKGGNFPAEIQMHPSGRFLYGSNRGHDSIAVFAVDGRSGKLTWVEAVPCQGKNPRHFQIDPTGRYLYAALQDSDAIVPFKIDATTGRLTPAGAKIEVGSPVCVLLVPAR